MSSRRLEVTVNERLVGHLRERNDLWEFEYSTEWMESPDSFDLSPTLQRREHLHVDGATDRPVQWYFDNLLPEEALRAVLAKEADLSAEDAFGLLAYFGAESAGSLVLRDSDHPTSTERGLRPLAFAELSRRIRNMPQVSLTRDAPKHMSLAGAQSKLLVVLEGKQLFEPLPGTASTHILKPNHMGGDYSASVMNEYFTMRLASAVGIKAPPVRRMYVPQPVYLVERFDRTRVAGSNDVQRRHVIDTCQLLNKARTFKYTSANLETLRQAITWCRAKAVARQELYTWLVFNVLVGNADNHLKNVSFLVDATGINHAPAYDLLSTAVYDTKAFASEAHWPDTPFAFSLGDAKTFGSVTRRDVLAAGQALGLSAATAARQLDRLIKGVPREAATLIDAIHAEVERDMAGSAEPSEARGYVGGEMRLLDAVRHTIVNDMIMRLA